VEATVRRGVEFYKTLQVDDGHWPGDYGGPMFLMPGLVITCFVSGVLDEVFPPPAREATMRYLHNHQNEDGGWGLHIEGHSTMFGTVLTYVTLRLLGEEAGSECLAPALQWILSRGGAVMIPSWGKFWLAVLGCYSWDGLNPMPPEMWLLPYKWNPLHPGRFWCHCRMVYLPMSYVYGVRGTSTHTEVPHQLRDELFTRPFKSIDWNKSRNQCAAEDLYYPHPLLQDVLWWGLYKAEGVLIKSPLRRWACREVMKHVHYEDENTRYIDIGPVNKALNMLACFLEDPTSEAFRKHIPRIKDYLWVAEDGLKMQGYNGSQLWDTTFAVQVNVP
jgi:cycloartenol synthase